MKNTLPQKALCFCALFLALNSRFSPAFAQSWNLTGNAGADPTNGNFIGTTDNLPLEIRVNGQRALRLEPNTNDAPNVIGGAPVNFVAPGVIGAVIAGGGGNSLGGPATNSVSADFGVVGGGLKNSLECLASTIAGGLQNVIQADCNISTIGGGGRNTIQLGAFFSTISGGQDNVVDPGAHDATISGGEANSVTGAHGTVAGGIDNSAAAESFAAGAGARAIHANSFVWNDGASGSFATTVPDQFLVHANGGVGIGLNNPAAALHVSSGSSSPEFQITQTNPSDYTRLRMNIAGRPSWEIDVTPTRGPALQFWNTALRMSIDFNGNVTATSFISTSDRNLKENISPISPREMLDKVTALPITRWNFKEDAATKHVGPMAQDFYAAFGVGPDDKHIATVDESGVALAAIQGLNQKLHEELNRRDVENAGLKRELDQLKATVEALKQKK